jgi:hypothetical protein
MLMQTGPTIVPPKKPPVIALGMASPDGWEREDLLGYLRTGPKTFGAIRRFLHVCCSSESRASTTATQLDMLMAAGRIKFRNGCYESRGEKAKHFEDDDSSGMVWEGCPNFSD